MSSEERTVFLPTGKWFEIVIDTDPDTGPSPSKKPKNDIPPLKIPTYALATYTKENPSAVQDTTEYCCLGATYGTIFIQISTLQTRLQDRTARDEDYNMLMMTGGTHAKFEVLDKDGTTGSIPRSLRLDPAKTDPTNPASRDAWDAKQLTNWRAAAQAATKPLPNSWNTYMRFGTLPKDVTIYFAPDETIIDTVRFNTIVESVLQNPETTLGQASYHYKVLTHQEALRMGLKLVGTHFLQYYETWMTADDYEKIWIARRTQPLPRPFPNDEPKGTNDPFEKIQKKLTLKKVPKDTDDAAPETGINSRKMYIANIADRGMYDDQQKVMNNTSATFLSNLLWPGSKNETPPGPGKHVAEWLHRNAFRYGGLGDSVNVATSQDPGNLIFGTKECNTHMIRAENTISKLLHWERGLTGLLKTTNVRGGGINRMTDRGEHTPTQIPTWTKKRMYSWLSFRLDYQWTMNSMQKANQTTMVPMAQNAPRNVSYTFDPWSRYVPLKLEAHLDDAVIDYLYSSSGTATAPTTTSKAMSPMRPALNAQPPSATQGWHSEGTSAWQAAKARHSAVTIDGIEVLNPRISLPPRELVNAEAYVQSADFTIMQTMALALEAADSSPPDSGFVLEGEIKLFGIPSLIAELERWVGPAPDDGTTGEAQIERATLKGDFHLSQVIPQLEGTAFDSIIFRNVAFYHQNHAYDKTKSVGWHFNADWVIDESCGFLYQLLSEGLNVDQFLMSVHAGLGLNQGWHSPLKIHSVTLEGVFPNLTISPIQGLCFTSIGVRLFGIRELMFNPNPRYVVKYGFGVFGTMNIDVPGSIVPLTLEYSMTAVKKSIRLSAALSSPDGVWNNPLGVEGLSLQNVLFAASFSFPSPWNSLAFDISATFQYKFTRTILLGSYAIGGPFALTAVLQNIDATFINNVFELISSQMLVLPEFDMTIESATISIASGAGLAISLENVKIAGYAVPTAALSISSTGVELFGELTGKILSFDEVEVRDPFLKVVFASFGSRKKTDVMVGGVVDFPGNTLHVAAHLYRGTKGIEWTILAHLSAIDATYFLSEIVPEVRNTFLDLALKNVLFVAASKDDPSLENVIYGRHMIRKGVQFCATLDQVNALNDLMHKPVPGLVLRIGWSKLQGFNLDVLLPAELSLDLGNGIRTTPIKLGITTKPSAQLALSAGLSLPVANSSDPLIFSLILAANMTDASATAEMQGWLHKPFGLENVSIGPVIGLSIEIIYAQFVSTGTPSGFGAKGGLLIGEAEAQLAINISEVPSRQLLFGKLEKLNISDLVEFASKVIGAPIRDVPVDFLNFEHAELYICPAGITFGSTVYPQGFSFKADMVLFGKRANIECTVSGADKQIRIDGGVDNFQLGPLVVQGLNGPRAEVHCTIGTGKQYLYIDGAISLFDLKAQTSIQVQLLPKPILVFHTQLRFTDLFLVQLNAELIGGLNFRGLGDADFSFDADLQNAILEYIREQVMEQFQGAADAAAAGIDAAKDKVDEAQREWQKGVDQAEAAVKNKYKDWKQYNDTVRRESQPVIDNYLRTISSLQQDIDNARKVYKNAMRDAQDAVQIANNDRAAALAAARRDVTNAKADMDRGIDAAQRALDYASADLSTAFGDAQRAIDRARRNVQSLQNQINDVWRTVRDYENAPWYEFWKKAAIAGLMVTIGALEASKAVADGALWAAQGVLKGGEFLAKEAAVNVARAGLEAARHTGYASLDTANVALVVADETSQAAVDAAKQTLKGVEHGVEFAAFQAAIQAIEEFKKANETIYNAAVAAIEALLESAQYIAYHLAMKALEVAKAATVILDGAKEMLEIAKKASQTALAALQDVINFGTTAVDIKVIKLSGTLRGIIGVGGKTAKPLSAHVKGYFLGQLFEVYVDFDPNEVVAFITSIFAGLWKGLVARKELEANPSLNFAHAVMAANKHFGSERPAANYEKAVTFLQPQPFEISWFDTSYPVNPNTAYRLALSKREPSLRFGEPQLGIGLLEHVLKIDHNPFNMYVPHGPFSGNSIGPVSVREWTAAEVMQELEGVRIMGGQINI